MAAFVERKFETIKVERHGPVTLITLDRPAALNAFTRQGAAEVIQALVGFDADPGQRCAVLTGSPKAFAAGADIGEMAPWSFPDIYRTDFGAEWDAVGQVRKPWIAAVAGFALGGGCEVAMMADLVIAADSASFAQPEIRLGISPGWGGTQRLTRALGKAKAMEMCLTGRMMNAAEAEACGLVARVVPAGLLVEEALAVAARIAQLPPLAAVAVKEMLNASFELPLSAGVRFERRLGQALCDSAPAAGSANERTFR
jgi:enoyl-CoA hydratase